MRHLPEPLGDEAASLTPILKRVLDDGRDASGGDRPGRRTASQRAALYRSVSRAALFAITPLKLLVSPAKELGILAAVMEDKANVAEGLPDAITAHIHEHRHTITELREVLVQEIDARRRRMIEASTPEDPAAAPDGPSAEDRTSKRA